MIVDYFWFQLVECLDRLHLSFLKRKVQPLILVHAGLAYNMMGPDWHFGVWFGMWNMGSLSGNREVCK